MGYWKWVLACFEGIAWGILKAIALIPEGLILAARGIKAQLTWENVCATSLALLICVSLFWLITFPAEWNAPFPADMIKIRNELQIAWVTCFLLLTYAYYKDEVEEKMKDGYWDWLKAELGEAWKIIIIIPFAFWDLFKWIGSTIKEMDFNEIVGVATWENVCVMSGCICCLTFTILIAGFYWLTLAHFVGILLLFGISFLVSTYAYWRSKP